MPRKRTGTVVRLADGRWQGILTLNDGSRLRLEPFPKGTSKAKAREATARYAQEAQRTGKVRPENTAPPRPSAATQGALARWVELWLAERRKRGYTSVRENEAHWRVHIEPVLGVRHVAAWTAEDLRRLCTALDGKVRSGLMSWKTASNVWGTATKMCDDAYRSKVDALRCRNNNPACDVRGPDRGACTEKQFLYPSEFDVLMRCDQVPLRWRRMIAFAVYSYVRAGEMRELLWEDIDLDHGVVHVHRAHDRTTRRTKPTKSARARRFGLEPALMPLIEAMRAENGGHGRVIEMPGYRAMAQGFRRELLCAGVTRADLHEPTDTRRAITWHDLRATGITWMAVRGDDPLRIQQRAGHASFATTQSYIRTAEAVRDGFGEVFPQLPESLLHLNETIAETISWQNVQRNPRRSSSLWRRERDSNPR